MAQNTKNELLTKVGNPISTRINSIEIILALIFLISFNLKLIIDLNVSILDIFPLQILAIFYFFTAFSVPSDENAGPMELFLYKLAYVSLTVTTLGILFSLKSFPGNMNMILVGCISLVILFPTILFLKSKNPNLTIFSQRLLIRIALIAAFGLFMGFAYQNLLL
jgi:hypothetical protein